MNDHKAAKECAIQLQRMHGLLRWEELLSACYLELSAQLEAVKTPAQRLNEVDCNDDEAYRAAIDANDAYVGALQYRGNTVSYIKSKADNYGEALIKAWDLSGAKPGQSVLERIPELVSQLEAERKARETAENTVRQHGAAGAYKLLCDLKQERKAREAAEQEISLLEQAKDLQCQRAEAAEFRLATIFEETRERCVKVAGVLIGQNRVAEILAVIRALTNESAAPQGVQVNVPGLQLDRPASAAPIPDGVPCLHPGCLSHISHPCEGCGRIGGISPAAAPEQKIPTEPWKPAADTDEQGRPLTYWGGRKESTASNPYIQMAEGNHTIGIFKDGKLIAADEDVYTKPADLIPGLERAMELFNGLSYGPYEHPIVAIQAEIERRKAG